MDSVVTRYTLDLNAGLTQVLADGTNTYLYGVDRIGELQPGGFLYHLTDALGSVRHLVDGSGAVKLAQSYEPFGSVLDTSGTASSAYGFAGEADDSAAGLVFLRARYLSVVAGRFVTRDVWDGSFDRPLTQDGWSYVEDNPVNRRDPAGFSSEPPPYQCNWNDKINWYCVFLNDSNTDPQFLREFYESIADMGPLVNPDFRYAADELHHFLDRSGTEYEMPSDFVTNVMLKDKQELADIDKDLRDYLAEQVKPLFETVPSCGHDHVKFDNLASPRLVAVPYVESRSLFYAWNAHQLKISYDGSAVGTPGSYEIELIRHFHAFDRYDWHGIGKGNLTAAFDTPVGRVTVPDEWAARVVRAGLGAEFDMHVDWKDWIVLLINGNDWTGPTTAEHWQLTR